MMTESEARKLVEKFSGDSKHCHGCRLSLALSVYESGGEEKK